MIEGGKQSRFPLKTDNMISVFSKLFRQDFDRYIPAELLIFDMKHFIRINGNSRIANVLLRTGIYISC